MRYLLLLFLLCPAAQAQQLTFEHVDPGITPHLTAYKEANPNAWWPWGLRVADIDGDGKPDIYAATHHTEHGLAYRQGDDMQFTPLDIGFPPTEMPGGRAPLLADFSGSGRIDIVSTSPDHRTKTKVQGTDGTWENGGYRAVIMAAGGEARDVNGNGLLDVVTWSKNFGVTRETTHLNRAPEANSFTTSSVKVEIPDDLPQPIKDKLLGLESDPDVNNRNAGPMYWRGDLTGNGREDMIVQYGGSYAGGSHRWGRYLLRNEDGTLEDVTGTCGIPGNLLPILPPVDTHKTGRLSVLTGYGAISAAGLYVQGPEGQFTRQTDGRTVHQTKSMWRATYHTSAGYIYEANWLDLNGNGWLDCIVSGRRLGWIRVYENVNGNMVQRYSIAHWDSDGYDIADMNGDGKLDIVVGHKLPEQTTQMQGTAVSIFLNTTDFIPPPDPEEPEDPDPPVDPPIDPEPTLTVTLVINGVESTEPVEVLLNGFPVGEPGDVLEVIIGTAPDEPDEPPTDPDDPPVAITITPETIGLVETAKPGQSFILQAGAYRPFTLRGRSQNSLIAIGRVTIHGSTALYGHGVTVENSDHITLDGLTVSGGNAGIAGYKSHHLTVRNCVLRDNKNWGLFTSFCDDTIASNNRCHDNFFPHLPAAGEHGIYVSNSAQRPILAGNVCTGHRKSGIQINADKYSGGSGITRGAIVTGNLLVKNAVGINLDGCSDSTFERNIIGDGLRLFREDGTEASSRNLIKDNLISIRVDQSAVLVRNGSTGNIFERNVIALPRTNSPWTYAVSAYSDSNFISRHNVFIVPGAPFGGGQWGKDAKSLSDMGDVGSIVR